MGDEGMTADEFRNSVTGPEPPRGLSAPLRALWWDAKGDWSRAHGLVDAMDSREGMAVHAYLHRKEGAEWNANYWYERAGREHHRPELHEEWRALLETLLAAQES
jgi:hypothetical protein